MPHIDGGQPGHRATLADAVVLALRFIVLKDVIGEIAGPLAATFMISSSASQRRGH